MTVSALTYAQLEELVASRADVVVGTGRWTTAMLSSIISVSLKKWNRLLADAGDDLNLKIQRVTTSPSSTIGAEGWAPRQYIVAPDSCMEIRGIDIYPTGNDAPLSMMTFDEAERNDARYQGSWWAEQNTGIPIYYRQGGSTPAATNIIQIYPWADGVYTCDIRYLPAFPTALASTSYDFILGGEEFVILDAAMRILERDGRAGTPEFLAGLREERTLVEADILIGLARRSVTRRRDTWLERRNLASLARWRAG